MNEKELIEWLEDLVKQADGVPGNLDYWRETQPATAWLTEAESALATAFPKSHPVRTQWVGISGQMKRPHPMGPGMAVPYANAYFYQYVAVVRGAIAILKSGRLRTLLDGVRAETVSEVLDQALTLLGSKHALAATVLAGGALETHLLHLCGRNGLTWRGDGSIAKYDQAVGQARNAGGVTVYPATDSKLIGGWGGLRNDAAHDPTHFTRTVDEVRLMIEGIRQFIARIP